MSAVLPVRDGRGFLERSLPPLLALVGVDLLEVIVVDDGSRDGSGAWAAERGARLLTVAGGPRGPAFARNLAARAARGDVLFFVDADVVVHGDAVARVREALQDSGVVAVYGSYDDRPPDSAFASLYMNLRHHHVHQRGAGEASTFWAGCGAVRRDAFLAVGGYDASAYARPSIEDIELGYRLRAAGGRIRNEPRLQGTHLKRWTLPGVVHTDVACRALPWARLLVSRPEASLDLNAGAGERGRALLAAGLVASALGALGGLVPAWLPALLVVAAFAANRALFAVFRRRGGTAFAVAGILFHQLYYLYGAAVYAWCVLEHRLGLPRRPAGAGRGAG